MALARTELVLVCLEDYQGAYIDGKLVVDGHEVNLIDIINEFKYFSKASWIYLNFENESEFERFMKIRDGEMPLYLDEMEDWIEVKGYDDWKLDTPDNELVVHTTCEGCGNDIHKGDDFKFTTVGAFCYDGDCFEDFCLGYFDVTIETAGESE